MAKVLELLRNIIGIFLFITAIGQLLLYEIGLDKLIRMLKMEFIWKFLANFGT